MPDTPLSILHFSTADTYGGGARAAYRIHSGLRHLGHTSRMLVSRKYSADPDVDSVHANRAARVVNQIVDDLTSNVGLQYQFVPSTRRTLAHPWTQRPSIFQLFNTHGGYFATKTLPRLNERAPIVWWLADIWPLTGHCIYNGECERWRTGCGACPDLTTYPRVGRDTTAWLFAQKARIYAQSDITIVAPSTWTARLARESPLFTGRPVHHIPNGIDLDVFRPMDRAAARAQFDLPPHAPIIMFAAHVLDNNSRKGTPQLVEALNRATLPADTMLTLIGEGSASWTSELRIPSRVLGNLGNDADVAAALSAADVLAAPSIAENLASTVLESMACGVPAIVFDVGGMTDAVRHNHTGYAARYNDVGDLAHGIEVLLGNRERRLEYGRASRRLIETEFSMEQQSTRLAELYTDLAARRAATSSARAST